MDEIQTTHYDPVAEAYARLVKLNHHDVDPDIDDYRIVVEEVIGFLGEALDK